MTSHIMLSELFARGYILNTSDSKRRRTGKLVGSFSVCNLNSRSEDIELIVSHGQQSQV